MAVGIKKRKKKEDNLETEVIDVNQIQEIMNAKEPKVRHTKVYIALGCIFLFLGLIVYLILPKIFLNGDSEINVVYNEKYQESGYKAKLLLFKDITPLVKVDNPVNDDKVGQYEVTYHLDYKFVKILKKRTVNVIDNILPEITVEEETIKACPGNVIPEFSYSAVDGYDGDITDKVVMTEDNGILTLSVKDSSNNISKKELGITRIDDEAPKITLEKGETYYIRYGTKYSDPGYSAIDNCDGDITEQVIVEGTVGEKVGTYKVTYKVTDSSENTTEVTRTVIVRNNYLYNDGSIANGTIYLTFDDGPQWGTTDVILDILKEEGVKATFFVTCGGPDSLIKRIYDEGHTLALHTCSHDYYYVYASVDNYFADLNKVSNRVKNLTGYESKIIRFPGGSSNTVSRISPGIMTTLAGMVLDRGYRYYDWNVSSGDAGGANTKYQVYNNVINNISHGKANMVLMHDIKWQTRDALRDIIQYAKNSGFTFEKIEMDTYMIRHSIAN